MTEIKNKKSKGKKSKKPLLLGPRLKFKRYHKSCIHKITYSNSQSILKKYDYGLKSLEPGRLNPKQLEVARRVISRRVHHRRDKYVVHAKIKWPVTKKAKGIRMGKGKGAVHYYTSPISSGAVLYQIESKLQHLKLVAMLKKVAHKLPTKTRCIIKPIHTQELFNNKKVLHKYWTLE